MKLSVKIVCFLGLIFIVLNSWLIGQINQPNKHFSAEKKLSSSEEESPSSNRETIIFNFNEPECEISQIQIKTKPSPKLNKIYFLQTYYLKSTVQPFHSKVKIIVQQKEVWSIPLADQNVLHCQFVI